MALDTRQWWCESVVDGPGSTSPGIDLVCLLLLCRGYLPEQDTVLGRDTSASRWRRLSLTSRDTDKSVESQDYCESLALKLSTLKELPVACRKYDSVVKKLESKEKAAADPFAGMWSGQALAARNSRAQGREHRKSIRLAHWWI